MSRPAWGHAFLAGAHWQLSCVVPAVLLLLALESVSTHITTDCVAHFVRDTLAATSDNSTSADDKYQAVASIAKGFVQSFTDGFEGMQLRPLRILAPQPAAADMDRISHDFQERTGYKVIIELVDPRYIVRELVFAEHTSPLAYDGWLMPGSGVVDLFTTTEMVAQIDSFITRDSNIQWSDVTEFVREISSTYGGVTVGMPVAGRPLLLTYRRDVLAAANLSAPNIWEDLVHAAQVLNSTDFNADGTADYALCLQLTDCGMLDGQIAVSSILASMTQTDGPRTGFLWDPDTLEALGSSLAMTRTMELVQELLPYSASNCGRPNPAFSSGACAITIAPEVLFKAWQVSRDAAAKGMIGTAMVPGATRVLNRQTGRLEECTKALCPNALRERTYGGSEVLVNRAPHFGMGGFSGFVNAHQDEATQQAMYAFWSFMSEPIYSKQLFMTAGVIGPYRKSHLDTSTQSLDAWSALGYDKVVTQEFLTTIKASLEHPNFVVDLRMLGGQDYLNTLTIALGNASAGMAPAEITAHVLTEHTAILARSGPRNVVQESLRAGLGIVSAAPPPPSPPTPQDTGTREGGSSNDLAIILGVTIPLAVVLSALLIAQFVVRHRKRSLFGKLLAPPPGEDTTLVVTDIMGSTPLWETLGSGVMECALATHNAVVRQALGKWSGYEQATEGDSFVLAFHTPSDALGFAIQLQTGLLEAASMAEFMRLAWTSGGSPAAAAVTSQAKVFKGLRVRIGMHSGVEKVDVERNTTSESPVNHYPLALRHPSVVEYAAGRVYFGGTPLALAKAVGDAGAGGMVLLTKETCERLHPERALKGILVLAMGEHALKDELGHVIMYQAIDRSLVPRLAAFEPLRGLSELQAGAMDAPVGTVTIAFANMIGLATLRAWDKDRADAALAAYATVLKQLLHEAGGYLVDLTSSGLCIAAFHHPLDAVAWGAGLIEVMKHRPWDEELLGHELCEEVFLHEPDGDSTDGPTPPHKHVVLFRGPRIKIGIDAGKAQADVAPLTGRMSYHGKVMNRAARISSKASSGRQWCSVAVWEQAKGRKGVRLLAAGIRGTQLGAFSLKGVTEDVKLVEQEEQQQQQQQEQGQGQEQEQQEQEQEHQQQQQEEQEQQQQQQQQQPMRRQRQQERLQ
ncbi:hypothetical protein FOA52_005025 [Chlamydomonas sp. UWO 241]|nr:hypothetical protein FOA52_005025 [Chlamydomonas sp. UWO 241]